MPLLIAILLGLSGLIIVIYPLLGIGREAPDAVGGGPMADVAERERSARDALREVEFDHRLGNLDDADYQALRTRYERRALAALKARYQREQELDALIEQQLDALRLQPGNTSTIEEESRAKGWQQFPAADAGRTMRGAASDGARPARGPQARRRRGGRL